MEVRRNGVTLCSAIQSVEHFPKQALNHSSPSLGVNLRFSIANLSHLKALCKSQILYVDVTDSKRLLWCDSWAIFCTIERWGNAFYQMKNLTKHRCSAQYSRSSRKVHFIILPQCLDTCSNVNTVVPYYNDSESIASVFMVYKFSLSHNNSLRKWRLSRFHSTFLQKVHTHYDLSNVSYVLDHFHCHVVLLKVTKFFSMIMWIVKWNYISHIHFYVIQILHNHADIDNFVPTRHLAIFILFS